MVEWDVELTINLITELSIGCGVSPPYRHGQCEVLGSPRH